MAAIVPVTISTTEGDGRTRLHLTRVQIPLTVDHRRYQIDFVDGRQVHALAPPIQLVLFEWRLVLVFSTGEGRLRRVKKTQILEAEILTKSGMESLTIELLNVRRKLR